LSGFAHFDEKNAEKHSFLHFFSKLLKQEASLPPISFYKAGDRSPKNETLFHLTQLKCAASQQCKDYYQ
jgi:hypothetical protein